jgi:hypothetical protein
MIDNFFVQLAVFVFGAGIGLAAAFLQHYLGEN